MSREEDLIRSTTHAIASTVREVPALRLEEAPDELRYPARAPRRGRGRPRGWWSWGAPLTAAAVVVVLAIALVIVRDMPNGSKVPANPATSAGPGGVPRYYVALTLSHSSRGSIVVVGDSLTGKTLATFTPPAGKIFGNVTAAADDRTFVVSTVAPSGKSTTNSWYEIRLAPGSAHPARMTRLPITPQTLVILSPSLPLTQGMAAEAFPSALSSSGKQLAVAEANGTGMGVKVFSVATGRLLHDWTTNAPSMSLTDSTRGLAMTPALTWIDGDRALALTTITGALNAEKQTVRRLNVNGPASGDLLADSTVIRDVQFGGRSTFEAACGDLANWPPLVSADGKTFTCTAYTSFLTFPMTAGSTGAGPATLDYTSPSGAGLPTFTSDVLWVSSSGDTVIVEWGAGRAGSNPSVGNGLNFGVVRHGKFTPLRFPSGFGDIGLEGLMSAEGIAF